MWAMVLTWLFDTTLHTNTVVRPITLAKVVALFYRKYAKDIVAPCGEARGRIRTDNQPFTKRPPCQLGYAGHSLRAAKRLT